MRTPINSLVKRIRQSLGMTQEEFVRALGLRSRSAVGFWEAGTKRPVPRNMKKMAELAPGFAGELAWEIEHFEMHPAASASGRYSPQVRQSAHEALDVIFERGGSGVIEEVCNFLHDRADTWSKARENDKKPVPFGSKARSR